MTELSRLASTPRTRGAKVRVATVAGRQSGVITRAQLVECGLGNATISRWVEVGHLHRIHQGVYSVGHRALSVHGQLVAALFYAGHGAVLSHTTAAWWWRLIAARPRQIDVSIPGHKRSVAEIRIHRGVGAECVRHRGLPVTTVARTLLDFASVASKQALRRAVSEADYLRLLDIEAIDAVLGPGRPGSMALRVALERHRPQYARALSVLEQRFLELCELSGLPLPEVNVMVGGLMVDMLWREPRVIVELDGHAAHAGSAAMERDHSRDLALRAGGFVVLRYTWRQITRHSTDVLADLRSALRA
jgi:very-short-patch-repair endonuclease